VISPLLSKFSPCARQQELEVELQIDYLNSSNLLPFEPIHLLIDDA
jgi:hypothetical protein